MKIWICEDVELNLSMFDYTKRGAEEMVAENRGYTIINDCIEDGWAKSAVRIDVPKNLAGRLIESSYKNMGNPLPDKFQKQFNPKEF